MPTTDKRPLKVFLSYASQDKPVVRELSRRLVGEGWIDTWFDEKSLLPGQDWRVKIEEAVEESDTVIICLSTNSVTKEGHVQKELRYAREMALEKPEETIFLIPLRLDKCEVPRGLRFYQWVDYFGEKKDESYVALIQSLKLRYEQKMKLEEAESAHQKKEDQASENKTYSSEPIVTVFDFSGDIPDGAQPIPDFLLPKARESEAVEKISEKKAKQESTEKLKPKTVKPKLVEEKPARKTSQGVSKEPEVQKSQSKLGNEATFWFVGLIVAIFIIGMLASNNNNTPQISAPTSSQAISPTKISQTVVSPTITFTPIPVNTPTNTIVPIPTDLPTEIMDAKGVSMVLVPEGEFLMGSEFYDDTSPPHNVLLEDYYIDVYETTNGLYKDCEDAGVCVPPIQLNSNAHLSYYRNDALSDYPVIFVSWKQAKLYCEKWRNARLPTEAEWEKAARGPDNNFYPWGDEYPNGPLTNFDKKIGDTTKVGAYDAGKSYYGLYDMAGNVWEWVEDWYDAYPGNTTSNSFYGTRYRVLRGGSWADEAVHSDRRKALNPGVGYSTAGFRCAKDAP